MWSAAYWLSCCQLARSQPHVRHCCTALHVLHTVQLHEPNHQQSCIHSACSQQRISTLVTSAMSASPAHMQNLSVPTYPHAALFTMPNTSCTLNSSPCMQWHCCVQNCTHSLHQQQLIVAAQYTSSNLCIQSTNTWQSATVPFQGVSKLFSIWYYACRQQNCSELPVGVAQQAQTA